MIHSTLKKQYVVGRSSGSCGDFLYLAVGGLWTRDLSEVSLFPDRESAYVALTAVRGAGVRARVYAISTFIHLD